MKVVKLFTDRARFVVKESTENDVEDYVIIDIVAHYVEELHVLAIDIDSIRHREFCENGDDDCVRCGSMRVVVDGQAGRRIALTTLSGRAESADVMRFALEVVADYRKDCEKKAALLRQKATTVRP
jgi:hypothetical protein